MAVEIYLEPELQELTQNQELTEDWKKLAEELGMEGQTSLVKQNTNEDVNTGPSPYMHMNSSLINTFGILCPSVENYTKYNKSTIPYEVLKEIAICEKKGYFKTIKIWYDDIDPDPIVVGYIKGSDSWNNTLHLIARFGDEVLPLEVLRDKAKSRFAKRIKNEAEKILSMVNQCAEDVVSGKSLPGLDLSITTYNHSHI